MPKAPRLSDDEIAAGLEDLPDWQVVDGKLHREYNFANFVDAFGFMATAAIAIEAMNHHPEWRNVYNRVSVDLVTHDSGGITARDVELARKLEAYARRMQ